MGTNTSHGEDSSTSETQTMYHVRFVNYDDSLLWEADVEEGQAAHYGGETPTKQADDEFKYTFNGWDKNLSSITSDTTVKAVYTEEPNFDGWNPLSDWM